MTVTPAGAEVSSAVSTNWKKIWKKNLAPLADKRYYKKAASDARYMAAGSAYSKAETDAKLGGYYSKTETDAKYQPKGNYAAAGSSYTKGESDAKYAPAQPLYRGTLMILGQASSTNDGGAQSISFGATFPTPPTPHYIRIGDPVPAGCSGSGAAPNAAPGNICVFETEGFNLGTRNICSAGANLCNAADTFGAGVLVFPGAAGYYEMLATWAARPSGPIVNPAFAAAQPGAVNQAAPAGQLATNR